MEALVSIIITTYNRANLLGETLDSIISQTYKNWEYIIIDDGSNYYTRELMEFYEEQDTRIKYFPRPSHIKKGATACRNFGFSIANGEFINWFDSDDLMHPEYLRKQITKINEKLYDCSICNFSVFKKRPKESFFTVNNQSTNKKILNDYISGKINLGIQCTLWKRKTVSNYLFDESLFWAQELDFFFRILKERELNVGFLNETLIFLRRHEESMTGNFQKFNSEEIFSELKVRRSILSYMYVTNSTSENFEKSLHLYFSGFKMLFLSHNLKQIKAELIELKSLFSLNKSFSLWELKLYSLYILQRLKWKRINIHKHFQKFRLLISKINFY
mgnify:CR=1 FL=1